MRLKRLQIKDFLGIREADIPLDSARLHIFLGPNNSGKSSVLNAAEFAITGLCRDMVKKKDADAFLTNRAGKGLSVTLGWDGGQLRRTGTGCSLAESDLEAIFGPAERVRASMSGFRFLGLPPRDRRELVAGLSGHKGELGLAVAKACNEAGLSKEHAETMFGLAERDLDSAEKFAVARRVELKRELAALKGESAPGAVNIDGKEYDLTKVSPAQIEAQLTTRRKQRDEALRAEGHAKLLDTPDILEGKIAAAKQEAQKALGQGNVASFEQAAKLASDLVNEAVAEASRRAASLETAKSAYAKIEGLGSKCPTCRQAISKAFLDKLIADAITAGEEASVKNEQAKKKLEEARKDYDAKNKALAEARSAKGKADELHRVVNQLSTELQESKMHDTLEAEVKKLDGAVAVGEKLLEASRLYEAGKNAETTRAEKEKAVAAWDQVAKALGPEGAVRKITSKGFDLTIAQDAADKLLGQGQRVDVDGDWNITCAGKWSNGLSRSERLRLGAGFAAAFAAASGGGLVVIDEADILQASNRKLLTGWLLSLGDQIGTCLLASMRDGKPDTIGDAGGQVRLWWCEGGEVKAL